MKRHPLITVVALVSLAAFIFSSCGSGGDSFWSTDTGELPSVELLSVASGETVDFADQVPSDLPIAAWFYAPHCPACNAEASGVEEFAKKHGDKMRFVGLGTQDTFGEAQEFVERNGIESLEMLWEDTTFEAWHHFGIRSQPAMLLLDPSTGEAVAGWSGAFDEDELLAEAAKL